LPIVLLYLITCMTLNKAINH